ncbi:MAG TPA: DoxX family protein [Gemmatimonadales bacterium]|nr:DoxX family protein [Gemmatimonadales bacterium]
MNTFSSYAALLLRLAVGGVFLRHGIMKVEGGIPALAGFLHGLGFPFANVWAVVLMVVETVGAGCVLLGVLTRAWAVCLAVEMIVAILRVQIPGGHNFELEALLLAGAASLVALGDGPIALGMKLKRSA